MPPANRFVPVPSNTTAGVSDTSVSASVVDELPRSSVMESPESINVLCIANAPPGRCVKVNVPITVFCPILGYG